MDAVAESRREKTLARVYSMENEPADAGREGRTCLATPNSQARTETGKSLFS